MSDCEDLSPITQDFTDFDEIQKAIDEFIEEENEKEEELEETFHDFEEAVFEREILPLISRVAHNVEIILRKFMRIEAPELIRDVNKWNEEWFSLCKLLCRIIKRDVGEIRKETRVGKLLLFWLDEMYLDISKMMIEWDGDDFERVGEDYNALKEFFQDGMKVRLGDVHWLSYMDVILGEDSS